MAPRPLTKREAAIKHGWQSGLEHEIAESLRERGARFEYETVTLPFLQPPKPRKYTPDFILPNGIIVETKGRFQTADRQKMKLIQATHPDLDIRFVFSRAKDRISKLSQTTYGKWATTNGFLYAEKDIPTSWIKEPPNDISLAALAALR